MTRIERPHVLAVVWLVLASTSPALPQTPPAPARGDTQAQPDPRQDPRSTGAVGASGETLSDKLNSTGGVIRPPGEIAPDMAVRPADPGTTPVIRPPGTLGGDTTAEPK